MIFVVSFLWVKIVWVCERVGFSSAVGSRVFMDKAFEGWWSICQQITHKQHRTYSMGSPQGGKEVGK